MEAVEQSVPMICYPHLEDQFMYADRMAQVGYGRVVGSWSEVRELVDIISKKKKEILASLAEAESSDMTFSSVQELFQDLNA